MQAETEKKLRKKTDENGKEKLREKS